MNAPFFSIIIPSFNGAATLPRAVNSIVGQSFEDYEIIVVDDGSTDNTEALISTFGKKLEYVKSANGGPSAARNLGISRASGRYLVFLDADDWLSDGYLAAFGHALSTGRYTLALGSIVYQNETGVVMRRILPSKTDSGFSHGMPGSFVIARTLMNRLEGYDPKLFYSENTDLFLRMEIGKMISMEEIWLTNSAGICKEIFNVRERAQRYSIKKYHSIRYFLEKHKAYLLTSNRDFLNFKRIYAFCAAQNGDFAEARKSMSDVVRKMPMSFKSLAQYFLFSVPPVARLYFRARYLLY